MLAALVAAQPASERIGIIDFYGYGPLDPARLRAALPFKEGDAVPSKEAKQAAEEALVKLTARAAAQGSKKCAAWKTGARPSSSGSPNRMLRRCAITPNRRSDIKLPKEAHRLFVQLEKDTLAAVKKGDAGEDDSEGYALMKNPEARGDQLKIRDWVRANTATTYRVLETSRYAERTRRRGRSVGLCGTVARTDRGTGARFLRCQ